MRNYVRGLGVKYNMKGLVEEESSGYSSSDDEEGVKKEKIGDLDFDKKVFKERDEKEFKEKNKDKLKEKTSDKDSAKTNEAVVKVKDVMAVIKDILSQTKPKVKKHFKLKKKIDSILNKIADRMLDKSVTISDKFKNQDLDDNAVVPEEIMYKIMNKTFPELFDEKQLKTLFMFFKKEEAFD